MNSSRGTLQVFCLLLHLYLLLWDACVCKWGMCDVQTVCSCSNGPFSLACVWGGSDRSWRKVIKRPLTLEANRCLSFSVCVCPVNTQRRCESLSFWPYPTCKLFKKYKHKLKSTSMNEHVFIKFLVTGNIYIFQLTQVWFHKCIACVNSFFNRRLWNLQNFNWANRSQQKILDAKSQLKIVWTFLV